MDNITSDTATYSHYFAYIIGKKIDQAIKKLPSIRGLNFYLFFMGLGLLVFIGFYAFIKSNLLENKFADYYECTDNWSFQNITKQTRFPKKNIFLREELEDFLGQYLNNKYIVDKAMAEGAADLEKYIYANDQSSCERTAKPRLYKIINQILGDRIYSELIDVYGLETEDFVSRFTARYCENMLGCKRQHLDDLREDGSDLKYLEIYNKKNRGEENSISY